MHTVREPLIVFYEQNRLLVLRIGRLLLVIPGEVPAVVSTAIVVSSFPLHATVLLLDDPRLLNHV